MIDAADLHERPDYLLYQPLELRRIPELIGALQELLAECQQRGVTRVLVDLTRLENDPVEVFDRFEFGDGLAAFWDRAIRLAMFARLDQIDDEKFGVLVARNRGLVTGIFEKEEEAVAWLMNGTRE